MSIDTNYDHDLDSVLESASNVDLQPLVGYLRKKHSQMLTFETRYEKHQPNHQRYSDLIAKHIRLMGGNTFSNISRSDIGPSYYEIVCDVAKKVKAPFKVGADIAVIEKSIIEAIFKKVLKSLSDEEKQQLENIMNSRGLSNGGLAASSIVAAMEMGGFLTYQIAVIVANHIAHFIFGQGLSFATNAAITKGLSFILGPIGWTICGLWAVIDLSGPAYSVTIPCVIQIAILRMKQAQAEEAGESDFVSTLDLCQVEVTPPPDEINVPESTTLRQRMNSGRLLLSDLSVTIQCRFEPEYLEAIYPKKSGLFVLDWCIENNEPQLYLDYMESLEYYYRERKKANETFLREGKKLASKNFSDKLQEQINHVIK